MTKKDLCKDQREELIAKLTAFFKGLTTETINDVVAEAKKQAGAETIEDRKNELAKLFDSQMEIIESRLNSMNIPSGLILEKFRKEQDKTIQKMLEVWTRYYPRETIESLARKGRHLGIPVISRGYLGICGLMAIVRNGDKVGYTYLDPNEMTDNEEIPKNPYHIYDVETGKATLGKSPEDAEKIIKKQNRLRHITDEDIAVCVHTDVLSDHYLWSTGSRCRHSGGVPGVYLSGDRPRLDWRCAGGSDGGWGSASCRSRA